MNVSLNEIENTALKATRGTGYSWGLAEETGKSARWLAAHGLPWLDPLLRVLEAAPPLERPILPEDGAEARPKAELPLCPIGSAATSLDRAQWIARGGELSFVRLARPVLMLPAAAGLARALDAPIRLSWGTTKVTCSGGGDLALVEGDGLGDAVAERCTVSASGVSGAMPSARSYSRICVFTVEVDGWRRLVKLAERTYVPESDRSRTKGAGAGDIDND